MSIDPSATRATQPGGHNSSGRESALQEGEDQRGQAGRDSRLYDKADAAADSLALLLRFSMGT